MSWNFLGFHLSKSRPPSWSLMRPYKTPQFHRASILPWVLPSGRLTELYQICPKTRWGLHRISFGATFPQTTPDHGPICTSMMYDKLSSCPCLAPDIFRLIFPKRNVKETGHLTVSITSLSMYRARHECPSLLPPSAHPSRAVFGNSRVIVTSVLLPFLTLVPEQSPANLISDRFTAVNINQQDHHFANCRPYVITDSGF